MALDSINTDVANSCINISAVYPKYAMSCKALAENPDARLRAVLGQ
jgi:hypothetical protein